MAIFGNFDELTPAEALTVVGKATGTLFVRTAGRGSMEIHIRGGCVAGLTLGDRAVTDALELQGIITDLVRRREGSFEFRRRSLEGHAGTPLCLDVPVAQLVMNGLSFTEEIRAFQDAMPSPKTIFELQRAPTVWLGERLQPFFERVEAALRDGASAEELAVITRVSAEQACWFLYKLRLAGVVQPRRCATVVPAPARPTFAAPIAPAVQDTHRGVDLRHVRIARPARPFLSRLLDGITRLLRPSSAF